LTEHKKELALAYLNGLSGKWWNKVMPFSTNWCWKCTKFNKIRKRFINYLKNSCIFCKNILQYIGNIN
jgi:hypothetical protein